MLIQNVKFGFRALWKRPAFTLVAVLSLALGIGLNTTIFTVVNAVMLRKLPISEPERLVEVYTGPSDEMPYLTNSYPDLLDLREQTDAFSGLAGHAFVRGILTRDGRSELTTGEVVTANYFDLLGVQPSLGRNFLPEEEATEGAHPVLVLSHGLWQRRMGGDPDVIGSTMRISGVEYSVVGVAPRQFTGTIPGLEPEFWTPTTMVEKLRFNGIQFDKGSPTGTTRLTRRGTRWLFVVGRLAPGFGIEDAETQVATVFARLAEEYPDTNEKVRGTVLPSGAVRFHPMVDSMLARAGAVLLVAVGLVLLIACANVANMLLSRAQARSREIAVRLSVGASRAQLVWQLMTESLLLTAFGAVTGLGLAWASARLLSALQPPLPVPISFAYEIDLTVLSFVVGISLATAVVFGLAPAWRTARPSVVPALKGESNGSAYRPARRFTLSNTLVVGQLAVSLVLLVAGALLVRGLMVAQRFDVGFDPSRVAALSFDLGMNNYSLDEAIAFQRTLIERLSALPQVEAASLASRMPLAPDINMEGILIPGHHEPGDDPTPIDATSVGPDYFRVIDIPILEGRSLSETDTAESPRIVVINQAMASRYWPDRSPVGERLYPDGFDEPPVEIVGVVPNHSVRSVGEEPRPYLHFAALQSPSPVTSVLVRTRGPAELALPRLREEVLGMDPEIVFTDETTAQQIADGTLVPTKIGASLLGAFGLLALVLASVGLYGVIAYSVSRRTREVGLRMAMGARGTDVLKMVLGQGVRIALVGVFVGFAAAAVLAKVLSTLLYGVSPIDPIAYVGASFVLLAVAAAANFIPAWRASKLSPMSALRYE
ncbi:MAG TPA: ABC transporter permease [Vicinamibacteria bacterium]|nr:ABC transporter permease [Vicinamibacteria bacterium]